MPPVVREARPCVAGTRITNPGRAGRGAIHYRGHRLSAAAGRPRHSGLSAVCGRGSSAVIGPARRKSPSRSRCTRRLSIQQTVLTAGAVWWLIVGVGDRRCILPISPISNPFIYDSVKGAKTKAHSEECSCAIRRYCRIAEIRVLEPLLK